jgi:hypothetical protein
MRFEIVLLVITAVILTIFALAATYFLGGEIIRIIRDVTTRTAGTGEADEDDWVAPLRRIIPFRDRKVVQRIIDHLEDEGPST